MISINESVNKIRNTIRLHVDAEKQNQVIAEVDSYIKEIVKAFQGCDNCFGAGYTLDPAGELDICKCQRGKRLGRVISRD